ncbi:copper chaperone PCu(A)C [Stutzerimonas frequens]|uniref:copper chaperone PCu(A)C n=1 Tax=Stutzerimonas frequens TaxID=2968969 RepID=UPI0012E2E3AE|nr:copper chaperone PCu(A)C [Stutzerimonas frequens]MUT72685.1 copper chaperone PCu(A)C [Stutzerimonas frequens]
MLLRLLAAGALTVLCQPAFAQDHHHDHAPMQAAPSELVVSQAWSRAMPPSAPTGAVYFVLENRGERAHKLVGAQTPRAQKTELHTHVHQGDMMKMQQIPSVEVPAAGKVEFKPGGNHVMLFGLKQPLVAGESFPITLQFENGSELTAEVSIEEDAPVSGGSASGHHH